MKRTRVRNCSDICLQYGVNMDESNICRRAAINFNCTNDAHQSLYCDETECFFPVRALSQCSVALEALVLSAENWFCPAPCRNYCARNEKRKFTARILLFCIRGVLTVHLGSENQGLFQVSVHMSFHLFIVAPCAWGHLWQTMGARVEAFYQ